MRRLFFRNKIVYYYGRGFCDVLVRISSLVVWINVRCCRFFMGVEGLREEIRVGVWYALKEDERKYILKKFLEK